MGPIEKYSGVAEALGSVLRRVIVSSSNEEVDVNDSFGRVLSEDLVAPADVPPSDLSHMDGFAVISDDLVSASSGNLVSLEIAGTSTLLSAAKRPLRSGETVAVATGAFLPKGADTVVPREDVNVNGRRALFSARAEKGFFVYRKGVDVRRGEVVVRKGSAMRAQDIALAITVGRARVNVSARPRVSVLATGSELTNSSFAKAGKVRNSHTPMFLRLVEGLGGLPSDEGIARDSPEEVASKIGAALERSDFVMTSGGTSVGAHDVVGKAVASLKPRVFHHGIRMDRGRVAGVAVVRGKPILMTPGPIQGAMNAFLLFGVPIIDRLGGRSGTRVEVTSTLSRDWHARKRFPHFTKVVYVKLSSGAAEPMSADTESVRLLSEADGFMVVPEETTGLKKGSRVRVRLLPGFSYA